MAKIITRTWTAKGPTGKKVKHVAHGYQLMVNGQRERKVSEEWSRDEALAALVARQQDIAAGKITKPEARTLGQLRDEYLAYKAKKRSLAEDRRVLSKQLLPAFGEELPVRQLTAQAIAQYERTRSATVSPYTVANDLTILRHMLRLAKRWGYITEVPEIVMPRRPQGRLRFLDEGEIARLLTACGGSKNRRLTAITTLALNTGLRKAELLGLTWERVDLTADYGLSAHLTLYRTKNGKPRGVPLNEDAVAALTAVEPDPAQRHGPVFRQPEIRHAFEVALRRAGIEGFRFHDMRHTFASHFMMRGGNLYDLKEILGHTDIAMTARYAHLSPHHLRVGVQKLEGLASPLAQGMAQGGVEADRTTAKVNEVA